MKLKTLVIIVAILSVASILTKVFEGGTETPETDPRVGSPLVDVPTIEKTAKIFIRANGSEVTVENTDPDGSAWVIREYHDLPIDFKKLSTLVQNLREAKIMRFASANPDRMAKMDFGDSLLELRDSAGEPLLSAALGRNLSSGGRFVKFADEDKSYLASLSAWLDTTAKNWADSALVPAEATQVTKFEIGFDTDEPLVVTRENSTSPWTAEGLPEGDSLNSGAIDSLLGKVTGLRFTETAEVESSQVVSAREHARTFVLGLNDGSSYTVSIGREPAPPPPPPPPEPAEGEEKPAPPPEPKPGPVFAFVESSAADSAFNERMSRLGYQINDWTYTGMPDNRSAFITPAPPPATTPSVSVPNEPTSEAPESSPESDSAN